MRPSMSLGQPPSRLQKARFDLDQISMIVFSHAGKANTNDRRLITLMNASPLATKNIKERNEQTLSGKWRQIENAPAAEASSAKD